MACTGFLCKDIPKCDHGAIFSRIKHGTHSSCFSLQLNICTCVFPITKHPILLYIWMMYMYTYTSIWKPYFLKGFQRCNKHICKSIPGIDDFASYWLVEQQTTWPKGFPLTNPCNHPPSSNGHEDSQREDGLIWARFDLSTLPSKPTELLKIGLPKTKVVSQPPFFRNYVTMSVFTECLCFYLAMPSHNMCTSYVVLTWSRNMILIL